MTDHLSEAAIQQYAMDGDNCPAWMAEHVNGCERCRIQVNNYRLIFKEVGEMITPVRPDITELVLKRLEQEGIDIMPAGSARVRRKDWSPTYWLGGAAVAMLAAGWFLRTFLLSVAGDIPSLIVYILVGISVSIAVVRGFAMVVQYRGQLKNLDLS